MSSIEAQIEAQQLQFMQSWMHADKAAIKKLGERDMMVMIGTRPPELLDRPSFMAAVSEGFVCTGFRLDQSFIRPYGRCAWYAAGAKLDLKLGRTQWSDQFMLTALWRKTRFKGWRLAELGIAATSPDERFTQIVRRQQLWT